MRHPRCRPHPTSLPVSWRVATLWWDGLCAQTFASGLCRQGLSHLGRVLLLSILLSAWCVEAFTSLLVFLVARLTVDPYLRTISF